MDDIEVLNYIHANLDMGFIGSAKTGNKAYYRIASRAEMEIIISIFTENCLNTTKHLNFLAFAKAFKLNHTKNPGGNLNDVNLEIVPGAARRLGPAEPIKS